MNWSKLFGTSDPAPALRDHCGETRYMSDADKRTEQLAKQRWVSAWRDLRIDMAPWRVSEARLRKAI